MYQGKGEDTSITGEFDTWQEDGWFTIPLHIINFLDLGLRF